jgi:hypothetical protein
MKHRLIPLTDKESWQEALRGIPHGLAHTWDWCHAVEKTHGLPAYLYAFELDSVRIVSPIIERDFNGFVDITTPHGFSGFTGTGVCNEFAQMWVEFARTRNWVCGYFAQNPAFENAAYYSDLYPSHTIYQMDLSVDQATLWARLHRIRRRELRDWSSTKHLLIHDSAAVRQFILGNYHATLDRVHASAASYLSIETVDSLLQLPNVFMAGAGTNGTIEAAQAFAYTPDLGECLFNIALETGKHHNTSLFWSGVERLQELHVPLLNMGGGMREGDSTALAKEKFGPAAVRSHCLKQVYQPAIYSTLCQSVGADPTDFRGYFPAFRAPALPDRSESSG